MIGVGSWSVALFSSADAGERRDEVDIVCIVTQHGAAGTDLDRYEGDRVLFAPQYV